MRGVLVGGDGAAYLLAGLFCSSSIAFSTGTIRLAGERVDRDGQIGM